MASINISDLHPSDSERYIRKITEEELSIQGGFLPVLIIATAILLLSSTAK